ncbi:ABC transporter substrate-binding protein [Paenirhodobacter populi]|uniref:ABC transporter substrate-binding protein n=1 Tax=Paenirhodobacter populi TaxID=2306993 RepID=UPI001F4E185E|nr:ABC transporter substrate-binding protein [Sinirhodobacter populi]
MDGILAADLAQEVPLHAAKGLLGVPRTLLLKVNAGHPALSDPRARQALSMAIDREGLAEAILRFPAGGTQLFPPSLGEWHAEGVAPLAYNPEKARALLAELVWQPGPGGILTRNGERFSPTLTIFPDRLELPLSAAVLQQMASA